MYMDGRLIYTSIQGQKIYSHPLHRGMILPYYEDGILNVPQEWETQFICYKNWQLYCSDKICTTVYTKTCWKEKILHPSIYLSVINYKHIFVSYQCCWFNNCTFFSLKMIQIEICCSTNNTHFSEPSIQKNWCWLRVL